MTRFTPVCIAFLAGSVILTLSQESQAQILDPVLKEGRIIANTIYDTGKWLTRVPYEIAMPTIARMKLKGMVEKLSLREDVYKRVITRIESKGLVDEIIPILFAVKELYVPSDQFKSDEDFDAYLRNHFAPESNIPGFEHTMFQWRSEKNDCEGFSGFGLDDYVVAQLVYLYDALYLQGKDPDANLDRRLECEGEKSESELRLLADRTMPIIRDLLQYVAGLLHEGHEYKSAVVNAAREREPLQAITASLIELVTQQVCKHYRIFATRVYRQAQLREWMRNELNEEEKAEGSGRLWSYLQDANEHRRYAMHIVVDGLQGHLIEALARGDGTDVFITRIVQDHLNAGKFAPKTQHSQTIESVLKKQDELASLNFSFVEHFARHGFSDDHYLRFFRDLYDDRTKRGSSNKDPMRPYGIAVSGISTTPTISVRNLPIAISGAPVAGRGATGVPNFHFVDRRFVYAGDHRGRAYYFFGNDALRLEELSRKAGMKTIFRRLPRLTSLNCGAQYDGGANYTVDAFLSLAVGERIRDFGDVICISELEKRAENERLLRQKRQELLDMRGTLTAQHRMWEWYDLWGKRNARILAERLIDEIAELEQNTIPEYFLYYNPWPDHFAHFKGPFSDEIISPSGELNRLDYWLRRYAEIYKVAGVYDRALFGMAGDHGLTPVYHLLNPEIEIFDALRKEGVDFKVVKISSDEGEGPKLNNRLDPPSMKGIDVVVASTAGGNYMLDLFLDQGAGFTRQPLYRDLLAVKPLRHQNDPAFEPANIIDEIYDRLSESLDYLVVREEKCTVEGGTVRITGRRNGKRAVGLIERRGRHIFYKRTGSDLLNTEQLTSYARLTIAEKREHARLYEKCHARRQKSKIGAVYDDPATWCTEREWRLLTSYTDRPDSVVQLAHLYDIGLAGTINLFPKKGIGYNTTVPGRHAGEHFHEKDAFVGLWGAPVVRTEKQGRIRTAVNGSMPTAIYEYLSGTRTKEGEDGWGYPSLGEAVFGK